MITEVLLAAIADAVFGKALDVASAAFNLDERVQAWLRGDLARIAYKRALARAYSAFARQYPELLRELFTEPFLEKEAAPELARLLAGGDPDPIRFATAWVLTQRHHVNAGALMLNGRPTSLAINASAYFLKVLRAELRQDDAFRPTFDSKVLDALPEISAKLDELRSSLASALQAGQDIDAQLVIGGNVDAQGDFVTGNKTVNYYFAARDFLQLQSFYVSPDDVFDRVDVDNFVGRRNLLGQIDAFLSNPNADNGLLLIEGEAGLGKTALMAHLVQTQRYFHVFGDHFNGEGKRIDAAAHLAAQVVSRFQLADEVNLDFVNAAASERVLRRVLDLASKRRAAGERIVIVYDALDQSGKPTLDQNPLGMPQWLPKGVFVVATQRPVQTPPNCKAPKTLAKLSAADDENRSDIVEFLRAKVRDARIEPNLGVRSPDDFVRALSERANGNWMYLHFVLKEMEDGLRGTPLALETLPKGLNAYYCDYWQRQQTAEHWNDVGAPLLGILGAIEEPVALSQICDWSELQPGLVKQLLEIDWRAFVSVIRGTARSAPSQANLYQFIHRSLSRFVRGESEDGLSETQLVLVGDMRDATQTAHGRIVAWHKTQCAGRWHELAADAYARRNLAYHLSHANLDEMFGMLTRSDRWATACERVDGSYAGYLRDLQFAWSRAAELENIRIGESLRCALIRSTIHSLANNVPADLMSELLRHGLWPPVKVIGYVRQLGDALAQSNAIEKLLQSEVFADVHDREELVKIGVRAEVHNDRATAIQFLAAALPEEHLPDAFRSACEIEAENVRAAALIALSPFMPPELLPSAQAEACVIQDEALRFRALSAVFPLLRGDMADNALQLCMQFSVLPWRIQALYLLAANVSSVRLNDAVSEQVAALETTDNRSERVKALSWLVPLMTSEQKSKALALLTASSDEYSEDERVLAQALANVVPEAVQDARGKPDATSGVVDGSRDAGQERISAAEQRAVFESILPRLRALDAAMTTQDDYERASALSEVFASLPGGFGAYALMQATQSARRISNAFHRSNALTALSSRLYGAQKNSAVRDALLAAKSIDDAYDRVTAISNCALGLRPLPRRAVLNDAFAIAMAVPDAMERAIAICELTEQMLETGRHDALTIVLNAFCSIADVDARLQVIDVLSLDSAESAVASVATAAATLVSDLDRESFLVAASNQTATQHDAEALSSAVAAAALIRDEGERINLWIVLLPHLPIAQRAAATDHALEAILDVLKQTRPENEPRRKAASKALVNLAPFMNATAWSRVFAQIRRTAHTESQLELVAALAPIYAGGEMPQTVAEALTYAKNLPDAFARVRSIALILPVLDKQFQRSAVTDALEAVHGLEREEDSAYALNILAAYCDEETSQTALALARVIADDVMRNSVIESLFSNPSVSFLELLKLVAQCRLPEARANLLCDFASRVSEQHKPIAQQSAYEALADVSDAYESARLSCRLAAQLQDARRAALYARARTDSAMIDDPLTRFRALMSLVSLASDKEDREAIFRAAHAAVSEVQDQLSRREALVQLAKTAPSNLLEPDIKRELQTVQHVQPIDAFRFVAKLPSKIREPLHATALQSAWDHARGIEDGVLRALTLGELAQHMPIRKRGEAYREAVQASLEVAARASATSIDITAIITKWQEIGFRDCTLADLRDWMLASSKASRAACLYNMQAMIPLIKHLCGEPGLIDFYVASCDITRWWP